MAVKELEKQNLLLVHDGSISFSDTEERAQVERPHLFGKLGGLVILTGLRPVVLHASVFLLYSLLFLYGWYAIQRNSTVDKAVSSPYIGEYESKIFEHKHSVFVGKPSVELDEAWKRLLSNINIRITEQEILQIPGRKPQAISLPDGGYFASPSVYHDLHCVKRLHHYMYQDHYFPNITQDQKRANEVHNHHCLDMIRQSLMCQGDAQVLTMKWIPDERLPTPNYHIPHKCINWENLDVWAESRRLNNLFEPGYLVHPNLGPAYPDGHGDPIGESIDPM